MDAEEKYKYTYTPCNPVVCGDSGQPASAVSAQFDISYNNRAAANTVCLAKLIHQLTL